MDSFTNFSARPSQFLLIESDLGASVPGASEGPERLLKLFNSQWPLWQRVRPKSDIQPCMWPTARQLSRVNDLLTEIYAKVGLYFEQNPRDQLTILSGDHSSACGAIAGLKHAFPQLRLGVVWIDAHADIHTPATTPSGNLHGMPLGASLSDPDAPLVSGEPADWQYTRALCGKAFSVSDLVYIGIRDLEAVEWEVIKRQKIRYWTAEEVRTLGADVVASNALQHLEMVDLLYISFDIDALDAALVPGTGTPVDGGIDESEARILLNKFTSDPRIKALEVTEFNPRLDSEYRTLHLLERLFQPYTTKEFIDDESEQLIL